MVDALYRRHTLLVTLDTKLLDFDLINEFYQNDDDFSQIFQQCSKGTCKGFCIHEGFLLETKTFVILGGSLRRLLITKSHEGRLMVNFGVNKTS